MTEIRQSFFTQISKIGSIETQDGKINTENELKELGGYLNGTKKFDFEMNDAEKNELQKIYDKAKKWINDNIHNNEDAQANGTETTDRSGMEEPDPNPKEATQANDTDTTNRNGFGVEEPNPNPNSDEIAKANDTDTTNRNGFGEEEPNPDPNSDEVTKANETERSDRSGMDEEKPDPNPNEATKAHDTDTSDRNGMGEEEPDPNPDEANAAKDNKKARQGGKQKVINGKRVIEMPNGDLYDMSGRKIRN